jgi:RHS repeat-associated protein
MEYYFDLDGNTIAQISVPFEKDTLKPIGAKKRITRMEYDQLNRLVKIIQPHPQFLGDGPITRQEYDLLSNVVKITDPLGNMITYRYDNLKRKISETNSEGGITIFTYHEDGQMRSLTDPVGNTTSWTYNLLGRVSREMLTLDKKMRTRYFYYDVAGNIIIKVDRNNRVTSWTYDKLNRATSEVWHDTWRSFHENKQPIKKFTTTYNHSGKIASTEDGDSRFTFVYGIFGNEIKQTPHLADLGKAIELNFVTDINGFNTEKIVKVYNKIDHINKYEVDALNRISNISQSTDNNISKSLKIQYDDLGQLVKQTRFDSGKEIIATKNKYDLAGHLTNISHTGNNKTIYADYDLKWDNANRIADFDFTYLNGPEKRSESKYRYDKTSQLINASYNFMQHEKYDFDLNGNRKQAEIQGQKQAYKTGEYNRLLSDENYSYEYDLEGNRISKTDKDGKTTKYTWDNRNRLVKVSTPTSEIEYLYDYQNRLVKRTENKTNQQYFVHDNWQIILQFDNKEPNPTHRYLWGTKQDELICDNNNWTLGDHLNTIHDIVKSDGTLTDHLDYNSFGKLISETKNLDSTFFAYTGKLIDKSNDLQWNINRWYDFNVGRWMSEDPIGYNAEDVNIYRYVNNIPLLLIDTHGLYWKIKKTYGSKDDKKSSSPDEYIKLKLSTDGSTYITSASVSIRAEAVYDYNHWWFSSVYKIITANKSLTVDCDFYTGEIDVHGCGLTDGDKGEHLAVRVNTTCNVNEAKKSVKIVVYAASAYTKAASTLGISANVMGTGGGISYSIPESILETDTSWEWDYVCECKK